MASSGSVRAGGAYVEAYLDDSKFNRGLRKLQANTNGIAKGLALAGGGGLAGGLAITGPLDATVQSASAAFETMDRFRLVFGPLTDEADDFAKTLANKVNRSVVDLRRSMSSFFSFFRGVGFDPSGALELSKAMQQLALDFASINNIADEEGFSRFISALSGSSEVLDQFGINIKQSALELELLNLGIQGTYQDATEAQKSLARVSIIARELGKGGAIGNAITTAYSYANSLKGLQGALKDLQIAIGLPLLPIRAEWNQRFAQAVRVLTDFATANDEAIVTLATAGSVILAVGGTLLATSGIIVGTSLAFGLMGKSASLLARPFTVATGAVYRLGTAAVSTAAATSVAATRSVIGVASSTVGLVGTAVASTTNIVTSSLASMAVFGGQSVLSLTSAFATSLIPAMYRTAAVATTSVAQGLRAATYATYNLTAAMVNSVTGSEVMKGTLGGAGQAIGQFFSKMTLTEKAIFGVAGAAIALGTSLVVISDTSGRVSGAFAEHFQRLLDIAKTTASGIFNALATGNWSKAIEIAGAAMYATWRTFLYGMANVGVSVFGEDVTNMFFNVGKAAKAVFTTVGPIVLDILWGIGKVVEGVFGFVAFLTNELLVAFGITSDVGKELTDLKKKSDDAITNLKKVNEAGKEDDANLTNIKDQVAATARKGLERIAPKIEFDPKSFTQLQDQAQQALQQATQGLDLGPAFKDPLLDQYQNLAQQFQQGVGAAAGGNQQFQQGGGEVVGTKPLSITEILAETASGLVTDLKGSGAQKQEGKPRFDLSSVFQIPKFDKVKETGQGLFDALFPGKPKELSDAEKKLNESQEKQKKKKGPLSLSDLIAQASSGSGSGESKTFGTFSAFAASSQRGAATGNGLRGLQSTAERHKKVAEEQLEETKKSNKHMEKVKSA